MYLGPLMVHVRGMIKNVKSGWITWRSLSLQSMKQRPFLLLSLNVTPYLRLIVTVSKISSTTSCTVSAGDGRNSKATGRNEKAVQRDIPAKEKMSSPWTFGRFIVRPRSSSICLISWVFRSARRCPPLFRYRWAVAISSRLFGWQNEVTPSEM